MGLQPGHIRELTSEQCQQGRKDYSREKSAQTGHFTLHRARQFHRARHSVEPEMGR